MIKRAISGSALVLVLACAAQSAIFVRMDGFGHNALGLADLTHDPLQGTVTVSNIGSSGQDGVKIDVPRGNGFLAAFTPPMGITGGQKLSTTAGTRQFLGGVQDNWTVELRGDPVGNVAINLSPPPVVPMRVVLKTDDIVVGVYDASSPPIVEPSAGGPVGVNAVKVEHRKLGSLITLGISLDDGQTPGPSNNVSINGYNEGCDEMVFFFSEPVQFSAGIYEFGLTAENIPSFVIGEESMRVEKLRAQGLGQAACDLPVAVPEAEGLRVSNIGSSGQDGVRLAPDEHEYFELRLKKIHVSSYQTGGPSVGPGETLSFNINGLHSGAVIGAGALGVWEFQGSPAGADVFSAFPFLGNPAATLVEPFAGGVSLGEQEALATPGAPLMSVAGTPEIVFCEIQSSDDDTGAFEAWFSFASPVSIQPAGSPAAVAADAVRVRTEFSNPVGSVDTEILSMDLRGAGISPFDLKRGTTNALPMHACGMEIDSAGPVPVAIGPSPLFDPDACGGTLIEIESDIASLGDSVRFDLGSTIGGFRVEADGDPATPKRLETEIFVPSTGATETLRFDITPVAPSRGEWSWDTSLWPDNDSNKLRVEVLDGDASVAVVNVAPSAPVIFEGPMIGVKSQAVDPGCDDKCLDFEIEWDDPVDVVVPNLGLVQGDRVSVRILPVQYIVSGRQFKHTTLSGFNQIGSLELIVDDLAAQATGDAKTIDPGGSGGGGRLAISNIGSSGQDGVRIDLTSGQGPLPNTINRGVGIADDKVETYFFPAVGTSVSYLLFKPDGTPLRASVTTSVEQRLKAEFREDEPKGVPRTVTVRSGGVDVGSYQVPGEGLVATRTEVGGGSGLRLPIVSKAILKQYFQTSTDDGMDHEVTTFDAPSAFHSPDGIFTFIGDEIDVAVPAQAPGEPLGSLEVRGVALENLELFDIELLPAACDADVTTTNANPGDPGYGVPDGGSNGTDLSYFVEFWLAGDLGVADVTTTSTNPGDLLHGVPDLGVNGADLSYFVELWLGGCP